MIPKISDIFSQKISEIQSRLPVKIKGFDSDVPFQEYLDASALAQSGIPGPLSPDATLSDGSSDNVAAAKAALEASNAYVPEDKTELMELINKNLTDASKKYGIDINLLRAVMKLESGFHPYSISKAGAQGLMQLMPGTAKALGVTDPFDIGQNIDGGAKYLRDQLVNFSGNTELALAAYNAGPNSVRKYKGVPPFDETKNYVRIVMDYYRQYNNAGSR